MRECFYQFNIVKIYYILPTNGYLKIYTIFLNIGSIYEAFMYLVRVLFFLFWVGSCHSEVYSISTGNFPPFVGENIESQGLATKIIQLTMQEMGNQTEIVFLPWKRGFRDTFNGKYFGTYPYSKNEERQRKWHYNPWACSMLSLFFF